jgi:hypothetical protein
LEAVAIQQQAFFPLTVLQVLNQFLCVLWTNEYVNPSLYGNGDENYAAFVGFAQLGHGIVWINSRDGGDGVQKKDASG